MCCLNDNNEVINPPEIVNELVVKNLKLVDPIAKKYYRHSKDRELSDLIQDGRLGLVRAAQLFEFDKKTKFSTYANWWIRASILRERSKNSFLKWPAKKYLLKYNIFKFKNTYYLEHGEDPSIDIIINNFENNYPEKISRKSIENVLENACFDKRSLVETNSSSEVDRGVVYIDRLVIDTDNQEDVLANSEAVTLTKAIYRLNPFERFVIIKRKVDPREYSLEAVAELWGELTGKRFTREWIRQKEESALKKLKKFYLDEKEKELENEKKTYERK